MPLEWALALDATQLAARARCRLSHPLHKDFEKLIRSVCHRHQLWRVFGDFCEAAAISLANAIAKDPAREERYLKIVGAYEPAEVAVFPKLLGLTTLALEQLDCDFLGEAFMALELGSHWHGQFFTPLALCRAMAELTLDDDVARTVADRGFVTVQEPAAGAGAMVIGFAGAMRARGLEPQSQLHVVAIDKDPTAAHMCFVQLALLGIPAQVVVGDTLRMELREAFYTPAHWLGLWDRKLARGYALGTPAAEAAGYAPVTPAPPVIAPSPAQLDLFAVPARSAA
jgi:hypothetical protein